MARRYCRLWDARREMEEMLSQFEVIYPDEELVRVAIRGAATYGLSWFDAHMWAYAERFGLDTLWAEDFENGRLFGRVRARDPFVASATADRRQGGKIEPERFLAVHVL